MEILLFSIYHVPFSFLISAPCLQADYAVAAGAATWFLSLNLSLNEPLSTRSGLLCMCAVVVVVVFLFFLDPFSNTSVFHRAEFPKVCSTFSLLEQY